MSHARWPPSPACSLNHDKRFLGIPRNSIGRQNALAKPLGDASADGVADRPEAVASEEPIEPANWPAPGAELLASAFLGLLVVPYAFKGVGGLRAPAGHVAVVVGRTPPADIGGAQVVWLAVRMTVPLPRSRRHLLSPTRAACPKGEAVKAARICGNQSAASRVAHLGESVSVRECPREFGRTVQEWQSRSH